MGVHLHPEPARQAKLSIRPVTARDYEPRTPPNPPWLSHLSRILRSHSELDRPAVQPDHRRHLGLRYPVSVEVPRPIDRLRLPAIRHYVRLNRVRLAIQQQTAERTARNKSVSRTGRQN